MSQSLRNVQQFVIGPAGSEVAAVLVMMFLLGLFTAPLALFADAKVVANGQAPTNPCAAQIIANSTTQTANQVKVSSTSGQENSLNVYTSRGGGIVERVSTPLSVQSGLLPPNQCLGTVVSDLVRSDGEAVPSDQVTSWALSSNAGLQVFIYVEVSPRYGSVTPAGGYTGTVSMDDERAIGGNIPVTIHVQYPRLWRATMVCLVAAWVGFFWAWLIHLTRADIPSAGRFWLYMILQLAVLTIVSFPVLNAQILTNPDWTGDVSHYIALASLAGGGALATTPTLRALVDRAAIFMPGASPGVTPPGAYSGSSTASPAETPDTTAPTATQDATADSAPATNGDSPAVTAGTNGDSPSVPGTPPGSDDGTPSVPGTPPGPDDGTPSVPGTPPDPADGTPSVPSTSPDPDASGQNGPSAPAVPTGAAAGPVIPIAPSEN
jgi:hypothetical protein